MGAHCHQHHSHTPERLTRAFIWAVGLNLLFTIVEAAFAWKASSSSLLADAGHNLGDVIGLLLAGLANWLQLKPATARYSYGFKRTTILAAFANAIFLLVTAGMIAYQALLSLTHPTTVIEEIVMIVAAIGVLLNGGTALLFVKDRHHDLNVNGAYLHLLYDALISIGVVITAAIVSWTHWYWLDPVVALFIVVAIIWGTWALLRDSLNLLLDAVPHAVDQAAVKEYLSSLSGVTAIHDLHIWALSTQEVALTAHLVVPDASWSDDDLTRVHQEMAERYHVSHVTLQIERGNGETPCEKTTGCC